MEAKAPRTSSALLPPIHALAAWSCRLMVGHLQDGNELRWYKLIYIWKKKGISAFHFCTMVLGTGLDMPQT